MGRSSSVRIFRSCRGTACRRQPGVADHRDLRLGFVARRPARGIGEQRGRAAFHNRSKVTIVADRDDAPFLPVRRRDDGEQRFLAGDAGGPKAETPPGTPVAAI